METVCRLTVSLAKAPATGAWSQFVYLQTYPSYLRQKSPRASNFPTDHWPQHLPGFCWNEVIWLFPRQRWTRTCIIRSSGDHIPVVGALLRESQTLPRKKHVSVLRACKVPLYSPPSVWFRMGRLTAIWFSGPLWGPAPLTTARWGLLFNLKNSYNLPHDSS